MLEDNAGAVLSATEIEVEIPEESDEWLVSDLIVTATDGTSAPWPLVDNTVAVGDLLLPYIEVAEGDTPLITGDVFSADGDELIMVIKARLLPEAGGVHRGALPVPMLPAGDYILQIVITDPPLKRHKLFRQPLTVIAAGVDEEKRDERKNQ